MRIRTHPVLEAGPRTTLFSTKGYFHADQGRSYDVSPDGQRFVFIKDAPGVDWDLAGNATRGTIVVVLNWIEELKARVPKN